MTKRKIASLNLNRLKHEIRSELRQLDSFGRDEKDFINWLVFIVRCANRDGFEAGYAQAERDYFSDTSHVVTDDEGNEVVL